MAEKYAQKINLKRYEMKKIIVLVLAIALVLSFTACINININPETTKPEPATTAEEITTAEEVTTEEETVTETETETAEEATTEAETEKESNTYVFEGVSIVLPEGFAPSSAQGVTLAVYKDYPEHSDNISFVAANDTYETYTREFLEQSFKQTFEDIKGFTYSNSDEIETDGYKYVTVDFDVTYNNVDMHETSRTFFFGGKSVTITFTSVSHEFDDAFNTALQSIQIEK